MKKRPILFSTAMVQAILEGKKTMTRRVIKPQPDDDGLWNDDEFPRSIDSRLKNWNGQTPEGESREWKCLYGKTGDHLWVKETFTYDLFNRVVYRASDGDLDGLGRKFDWTPSIFMPRSASRITLLIKSIRVERLQDISDEDVLKEGITRGSSLTLFEAFAGVWGGINGYHSWVSNPWVWVIEFERP